ncbi:MAG: HAMP domain-containing sensor histidine kinase [Desulfitobacteriaceae bacterium]
MNIKKVIVFIIIILSVYTCLVLYAFRDRGEVKMDVVAVNDITESLAEHWENIDEFEFLGLRYRLDYVVIDNSGKLVRATRHGLNESINAAINNRDTIVDIKRNEKVLGKLIIYNNASDILKQYREKLLASFVVLMIFAAIFCLTYAIYIDQSILRPFRKLKGFARLVAEGKLDMPLDMDRSNQFGAFTESFDLMREELNRARENERIANQSKKELVASLSHDIKTPIASIKAVSEVMYAKSSDEYEQKQLEIINAKADQVNTLITNLFNATLEELQELRVEVAEQSSQLLYELIKNADYYNQVTVSSIPECIVLADVLRLAQVVDNVISNSYKYAGTSIDISAKIKENYLEIAFKDYGLGVSGEESLLIFNKFYRAKNSEGKSGTGLGLYIAKYLMNKMSGDIVCEKSEDGFVLKLILLIA